MRHEAERLVKQARVDLSRAERLLASGDHDLACFLCHQAVEKMLKGCIIEVRRTMPPRSHELHSLGAQLGADEETSERLKELNPEFAASRYPDAANGVPAEVYTRARAQRCVDLAREVFAWLNTLIP